MPKCFAYGVGITWFWDSAGVRITPERSFKTAFFVIQ